MRSPFLRFALHGLLISWIFTASPCRAEPAASNVRVVANLAYKAGDALSDYEKERCKLDVYLPPEGKNLPALVWFHGGGLTGGAKDGGMTPKLAARFVHEGIAFIAVNYRLSPKAGYPAYLDDTAAAFAWVKAHAAEHGLDPARIFVGGHSAGAYLTSMVGLDVRWLQPYHLTPNAIAGLIPVSGQMMTHFTVRAERGMTDKNVITADEAAPINHLRKDAPPMLILFGDKDWPARREENLYFAAALKVAGHTRVQTIQVDDRTHGSIAGNIVNVGDPAAEAILKFIKDPANVAAQN
jgi:acetyl esterase/lipase